MPTSAASRSELPTICKPYSGAPLLVEFLEHVRQLADDEQGRH
jgi:hypothetical protein